ncbi:hypothetical protein EYR36_006969 [Pleurotus pulmonarius]|nr:hypothetical protein EYR36_006969 [Pleurotus pulmonarius]
MSEILHRPYEGPSRRLVASIDIGTTFSAASFCILKPGIVPKFDEILSWPNQAVADGKVASVIYYDESGTPRAHGAETEDEEINLEAEDNGWCKAEWWKLGLRPEYLPLIKGLQLPELPPNVSIDQIFADFFSFVKLQIMLYISRSYADGANIWETLEPSMYFILTTPNGWEGAQQDRMRKAAIKGGLVDKNGGRRIKFVTEAEAALLYAANTGNVDDWLSEGGNVILCDCGGGTIDITGYSVTRVNPLRLEESSAAQCYLAGGVHVSNEAKAYFQKKLADSEWDNEDSIRRITDNFDRNAKKKFSDPERTSNDMAAFFKPSIDAIIEGLKQAFENGGSLADKIILVGGLASSPYVYSKVSEWGERFGISISSPDGPTTKAVANGALAWHLDNNISARVARYHYGIEVREPYDKQNPEMACRVAVLDQYDGRQMGQRIENQREFQGSYNVPRGLFSPKQYTVEILVYRRSKPPSFVTVPSTGLCYPGFETLCSVNVDLQGIWDSTLYWRTSPITGERYKMLEFRIHIALGETEVTARSSWVVKGVTRYGAATVAFD